MRLGAALLAGAAGWALSSAIAAHALEAEDIAWGCEDAGYVRPVERDGRPAAYRALVLLVHTDWGVLPATLDLPEGQSYTDSMPTCTDLDGDGKAEVVAAIEGERGGWLTVYDKRRGPIVSTEPVTGGLSVAAGADFDGDGTDELAWIEDPAGIGRLRIARLTDGALTDIAHAEGFAVEGADGTRAVAVKGCPDGGTDLVLPGAERSSLLRVSLVDGRLISERVADRIDGAEALNTNSLAAISNCAHAQGKISQ